MKVLPWLLGAAGLGGVAYLISRSKNVRVLPVLSSPGEAPVIPSLPAPPTPTQIPMPPRPSTPASPPSTPPAAAPLPSGTWLIWAGHAYQVQRYDAGISQYWLLPAAPSQPIAIAAPRFAVEAAPKAASPGLLGYVSALQLNTEQQAHTVVTGQDQYGMFITAEYDLPPG